MFFYSIFFYTELTLFYYIFVLSSLNRIVGCAEVTHARQ